MKCGRTVLQICFLALAAVAMSASAGAGESPAPDSPTRVEVLELTGDLRAPDPSLVRDERTGNWYVFSTGDPLVGGGTIQIRRSTDLHNWTYVGTV